MSYIGKLQRFTDAESAELLRVLRTRWPADDFDELNIATAAPHDEELLRSLDFIGPKVRRMNGGAMLSTSNQRIIEMWFLAVAGRNIDGLTLTPNRAGWCSIR